MSKGKVILTLEVEEMLNAHSEFNQLYGSLQAAKTKGILKAPVEKAFPIFTRTVKKINAVVKDIEKKHGPGIWD